MSEAWINRLWQLVLVCTFAVVLSVCNKALDETTESGTGSAVGTAFADGPVTISAMPKVEVESTATVSSMPVIKLDNGTSFAITSLPSLKADITSMPSQTVEILAAPKMVIDNSSRLAVSSLPSLTVASQAMPSISGVMNCKSFSYDSGEYTYTSCDASDNTELSNFSITHDNAFNAGWRLIHIATANGWSSFVFHK